MFVVLFDFYFGLHNVPSCNAKYPLINAHKHFKSSPTRRCILKEKNFFNISVAIEYFNEHKTIDTPKMVNIFILGRNVKNKYVYHFRSVCCFVFYYLLLNFGKTVSRNISQRQGIFEYFFVANLWHSLKDQFLILIIS